MAAQATPPHTAHIGHAYARRRRQPHWPRCPHTHGLPLYMYSSRHLLAGAHHHTLAAAFVCAQHTPRPWHVPSRVVSLRLPLTPMAVRGLRRPRKPIRMRAQRRLCRPALTRLAATLACARVSTGASTDGTRHGAPTRDGGMGACSGVPAQRGMTATAREPSAGEE